MKSFLNRGGPEVEPGSWGVGDGETAGHVLPQKSSRE